MKVRAYLVRSLGAAAFLLLGLAVAASLWGLLAGLGDSAAARVAKGVSLGLAICLALDLVVLIVLMALGQLTSRDPQAGSATDPTD